PSISSSRATTTQFRTSASGVPVAISSRTAACRPSRCRLSAWSRSKPAPVPMTAVSPGLAPLDTAPLAAASPARIGRLQAVPDAADGRHDRAAVPVRASTARAELVAQPVHVLGDRGLALPALVAAPHMLQ